MPELFLSYSRRDKADFVERFIKALNENGYPPEQIWVDWEDIPASVDWEAEIHKGIEQANSVIFVLTPNWAASQECAKELNYALKFNKRLFPVIYQNVDPKTVQPELAALNWIFFRDTDDFEAALQKLLAALKTDRAWVNTHTHLIGRAKEWDDNQREHGRLLRGGELQEAEDWLAKATDDKQPRPTALQMEYIFSSREAAQRAQRRRMFAVTGALVVSIALALLAVFFAIQAQHQGQSALAFQLAAQSTNLGATQPDLALLLSLEASYIGDELGGPESAWLVGGLVTSLNSSPRLRTYLRDNPNAIRTVAFSPDGKWLAAGGQPEKGDTAQVTLWEMTAGTAQLVGSLPGPSKRILALAFSPDSQQLIGAGDEGILFAWNPNQCCDPVSWPGGKSIRALVFVTSGGRQLIASASGNQVSFWEAQTGQAEAWALRLQASDPKVRILSLAVSPDSRYLAAGGDDGNVTVWDLSTRSVMYTPLCSIEDENIEPEIRCQQSGLGRTDIRGLAFSPNGKWLVAGSSDQSAWLWEVETGTLLARTPDRILGGHINTVSSLAFDPADPTGQTLATASWDNTLRVWQIRKTDGGWKIELADKLIGHSSSVWTLVYSPSGEWLASGSSDHATILWRPDQVSQIGAVVDQLTGEVWALATSPSRDQLAAGDEAGHIRLWDFDGAALHNPRTVEQGGAVFSLAFSPDGAIFVSAGEDRALHVREARSGQELWAIPNAHTDDIWSAIFSPDGQRLASASYDRTVKLWDVTTRTAIGAPIAFSDQVYALAFTQDSTQLLVAGYDSNIRRIDLTQGTPVLMEADALFGHGAAVNSLAFNPLYPDILATTSDDKTLLIWDIAATPDDNHTAPVLGLHESMEAVAFRPDGRWLASATNNKTVLLWQWNLQCGARWSASACRPSNLGAPLLGHHDPVANVVFLSNTALISSDVGGQLILWNLDKAYWYERACAIVNRALEPSEQAQYTQGEKDALLQIFAWFGGQPDRPSRPTCLNSEQP